MPRVFAEPAPTAVSASAEENTLAEWASRAGGWLSDRHRTDSSDMARGVATERVNQAITQWLSPYASVRAQLDMDRDFSLKRSQFDVLYPLHEQKDRLMFMQTSLHNNDEHLQTNVGLGVRYSSNDYLLGGNAFLDYDLSQSHARIGFGLEYWRDFLKFGFNSYLRLTGWKPSPDVVDYQARPANGWDIRAEGYLPDWPQLGGKLVYEQYYGNEVALFGKDDRQRNPYAVTIGASYTPFPLLTMNAERRQGKSGESEMRWGMELNYRLHEPWHQQVDPGQVTALRRIAGSRFDFVDRNNQIVLEYRKTRLLHLFTPSLLTGYGGEQKTFPISVNSKYALARIDWSASALLAQGGKIITESSDRFSVQLPPYRPQGDNTYSMSAVAVDTQGNMSRSATTQVTVLEAEVSALNSSLEPENISLPANGKAQQRLTLKVRDLHGNPVDLDPNEIHITSKRTKRSADASVVSAFERQSAGEYAATLTAGMQPAVFTIAPSARDITLATTHVTLTADASSAAISGLVVEANNAVANGKATNEITITVTDASGHRVPDVQIQLQADNDAVISATALTDAQGEAKVSLTSTRAGNTTVTANIKDSPGHQVTLVFLPDHQTAKVVELLPSAAPYLADGQSPVHYRALIKDSQGNPVPGVGVNWSSDRDARVVRFSDVHSLSNNEGIAVTSITSSQAFGVTVTAASPNSTRTAEMIVFTTGALSEANSLLRVYPSTVVAGKEKAAMLLVLRDKKNNPLTGQSVVAVSDKPNVLFGETKELAEGRYRIEVSSTHAQDVLLSVRVNDVPLGLTQPLAVIGDGSQGSINTVSVNRTRVTAGDPLGMTYSATIVDGNGNPLPGMMVFWQPEGNANVGERITSTDANGVAHITLKSQTAGILRMTAYLNDKNQKRAPDVTIEPAAIDQHVSRFHADKTEIGSDGKDAALLNVMLRDTYGNAISGKAVVFHGAESLSGFTITPAHDNNDGSYQANATSMEKGRVSLNASVEGKTIGSAVVISVGAAMPDLRFDNAFQYVTYTQQFRHSQAVKGAPATLQQMWSSSDPDIASVAKETGQITLRKAGSVTITVQTAGDAQYHPASASYQLQIAKASPGLSVNAQLIATVWGEGKTHSVKGHFTNPDVGASLPLIYQSDRESVVQVTDSGELRPIAPGNAMISLHTQETEQFLSEMVNVSFVLSKGSVPVRFASDVVTTTDLSPFTLQKPMNLPVDATIEWSSSEQEVIAITPEGQISGPLKKGKTRLRLTIKENAFYTTSTGAYDVQVFTTPKPRISGVKYGNNGLLTESGRIWAPVFTEDKLRVTWAVNSSTPYDAPRYVEVILVDEWGRKLDHQRIDSSTGSVETVFSPQEHYIGKRVHVEVVAYGHDLLQGTASTSEVSVNPTKPTQIYGSHLATTYNSRRIITSTGEYDYACQGSHFGRMHHALLQPNTRFDLAGQRRLMAPLTIAHKIVEGQGDTRNVDYPSYFGVYSSANVGYFERSHTYAFKEECWLNHSGSGILQTRITFTGVSEITNQPFQWHG
ncbi:inverse autotransporter beta domain-containing protein [Candidatus Symbiopectobacterium sp. NZEC135]|uniref:inverse autotransporter beta domain-containing protein n=1 Tax=Candidatus Symbiopectobacterium sp. NZEC135 TaxID=2820471 RepID=UPI00222789E8|nr:inverse autotransporter beta domain-containing protein [Candidatus Symbiopectobacterium sp. NZEC135]MCW2481709.1 inverse autotransporter beta domain-containing protein [Candidatus Symbiopectobacterium sp. NZEC135]